MNNTYGNLPEAEEIVLGFNDGLESYGREACCEIRSILYAVAEEFQYGKGNREYASDVFAMLMEDGEYRLDIYNALNGSDYQDPNLVEVITLESGVSLSVHNDASFLIGGEAHFYEHQSTHSPNMPLRFLIYFSHCLKLWMDRVDADIYSGKVVKVPTPHFVVFYNGTEKRPEVEEMRLSAAYTHPMREGEEPDLEVRCIVYNINSGKNVTLLQKSSVLSGYMHFVNKVRDKIKSKESLEGAIDNAIQECIDEDVLKRFFETRKDKVRKAMKWDLTMERHMRIMKKEEREEGRQEGRQEGNLLYLIKLVLKKVTKGKSLEEIANDLELEEREVEMIYHLILKHGPDTDPESILKEIQKEEIACLSAGEIDF
jgi:hypothetical protein